MFVSSFRGFFYLLFVLLVGHQKFWRPFYQIFLFFLLNYQLHFEKKKREILLTPWYRCVVAWLNMILLSWCWLFDKAWLIYIFFFYNRTFTLLLSQSLFQVWIFFVEILITKYWYHSYPCHCSFFMEWDFP